MGMFMSRSRGVPSSAQGADKAHEGSTPTAAKAGAARGEAHATPARGESASLEGLARTAVATTGVWRPFNWVGSKGEKSLKGLTQTKRFQAAVDHAFDECDLEHDGRVHQAELYVAVLLLYHRINSWPLGGGIKKPPSREEVADAMKRHDKGAKGYLTRDEFNAAARDLCGHIARGISRQLLAVLVVSPLVARGLHRLVDWTLGKAWPAAGRFFHSWSPDFLFVPAIASALIPIVFDSYDRRPGPGGKQAREKRPASKGAAAAQEKASKKSN